MEQIILLFHLWLFALYYQPADLTKMILNEQHHNQQVEVSYRDTLIVELPYQPGTGYYWVWRQPDGCDRALKLLDERSQSGQNRPSQDRSGLARPGLARPGLARPGQESISQLRFLVVKKEACQLNIDLKRSWEDHVLREYSVKLQIK
ncbi:MAG: protease inhibitor I42 family protein [Bacteroidota bacterium]